MKKVLEYFKKTIKKIKARKKEAEKIVKGGHPEEALESPKEK
ncbi:MAG: hypothetical protein Q8N59_01530 [bacterium]|nr:hypothetical protein [bacterium]